MTPEISITILFTVLGFYVLEYFVSRKAKSLREDYMKQLRQTHQEELKKVQDKLLLVNQDVEKGIRSMLEMDEKHIAELKRANERGDDNRREFVKQSEMNVELRRAIDEWKEEAKEWKSRADAWAEECTNWEETHKTTIDEREALEKELDRGNELIKWMKADLSTAYAIIKEQEAVLESLGIKEPSTLDGIDWSKPVPFPEDYKVPEGVEVVVVSEDRDKKDQCYRPIGIKGVTTESRTVPYCDWEDGKKRIHMICDELAPINPTDHPNHPQFKG